MASENETIADIVAQMRNPEGMGYTVGNTANGADISVDTAICIATFADRLDAAWKRERESLLTKQGENVNSGSAVYTGENKGGNAAAMRESLESCAKMGEQIDCQLGSSDETVYAFRHERCLGHNISECARAALASPVRNCDRYNDVEDAWQAYKQFRAQTGEAIYFDMVHFWPFANWLFSLAAERKGEGDEQK